MANLIVTNGNFDGAGSLRDIVAIANANPDFDTITFAPGLAGQTVGVQGELVLTNSVEIIGDINGEGSSDLAITGTSDTNLIRIASGVHVTLTSINVSGMAQKSLIRNDGTLAISYAVFGGSQVRNSDFTAENTSVGTIVNAGKLTIAQSVFDNNRVYGGRGAVGYRHDGYHGTNAAGAVVNMALGTLTTSSVAIINGTAVGGRGGYGGNGFDNGIGTPYAGYDGGDGGIAALGVMNFGIMSGSVQNKGTNIYLRGGNGGLGGFGSYGAPNGNPGNAMPSYSGNITLAGGTGSLTQMILGTQRDDTFGYSGSHTLGNYENERIDGLGGDDTIQMGENSTIYGGSGHDALSAYGGSKVRGGFGDDTLICAGILGSGNESWFGGKGNDTIDFSKLSFAGRVLLGNGGFTISGARFSQFENVIGSSGRDNIIGGSGANVIAGGGGNDIIEGGKGADSLDGGAGSNDTLSYEHSSAAVSVRLVTLQAGGGDAAGDTFLNFESVRGSAFADKIVGSSGANTLEGLAGHDTLTGRGGADSFVLAHDAASSDTITDFVSGTDKLQVQRAFFDPAMATGPLDAAQLTVNNFGAANDGDDRFILNTATHELLFDPDGTGIEAARLVAVLSGVTQLVASDFVIVPF